MKSKGRLFLLGFLMPVAAISGCGVVKESNHTNAMAELRRFATVNSVYYAERMEYAADLSVLYKEGLIYGDVYDAWDKHPKPIPLSGYLFTEIVQEPNGELINLHARSGLCAYPAEPGISGDKIFLLLLDDKFMRRESLGSVEGGGGPAMEDGFAASGGSKLFVVPHDRIGGPVTRWPTEEEMASLYEEISHSIVEGKRKMESRRR